MSANNAGILTSYIYYIYEEEGGYMVRTRNYVANDDQKNRAVRNAGHHP
jgi:hypothetical protein